MPYVIVGLALYLLYRYYAAQPAVPPPPAPSLPPVVNIPGVDPAGGGGSGGGGGGGGDTPAPAATTTTVTWQSVPEGAQLTPGFDYRASAPPQGSLVMMMIPGHLSGAGFTNVVIHNPGDAFPADWPDSGSALRVEATLPESAQPQTFNLDGVKVWQKIVTQSTAGQQPPRAMMRHVAQGVYETVSRAAAPIAIPVSNGVYAGLVRPPQSR